MVAERADLHADAVCAILRKEHGVEAVRIDTTSFPDVLGSFDLDDTGVQHVFDGRDITDARSVWWRRSPPSDVPQGVNRSHNEYRQAECDGFLQGLLWAVPALWVNDPRAERVASRKVVQLTAARQAGLAVPSTLITNDPDRAAEFVTGRGPTIYKRTGTSRSEFSETRLFGPDDHERLGSIRASPTTFQDYIEAEADLRVVWVAGEAWPVRIDSQSGAGWLDSRLDNTVEFTLWDLPDDVSAALDRCMQRLGLTFGVVDLRIGVDGKIYFLEVNPQGQFAYLEFKTGAPIFASLAALLHEPRRASSGPSSVSAPATSAPS